MLGLIYQQCSFGNRLVVAALESIGRNQRKHATNQHSNAVMRRSTLLVHAKRTIRNTPSALLQMGL